MNFIRLEKEGFSAILNSSFLVLSLALAGCFNEPEPAYKTVPAENRVYLQEKGLTTLADGRFAGAVRHDAPCAVDYLNLDRNQLTNVDAVASLTGLKWLRLNENRLASLPDLSALVNLRRIYLRDNKFTVVPETLKDLPALTDIELSGNPIKTIPDWLAAKQGLLFLSFNRTQVTALPADLSAWKSLKALQLGELNLSAEEMARIRAALPDVAITF